MYKFPLFELEWWQISQYNEKGTLKSVGLSPDDLILCSAPSYAPSQQ